DAARGRAWGSLMRHFLCAGGPASRIPGLPGGMAKPPRATVLIPAAGRLEARAAGPPSTCLGAVAIAPITAPTQKEHSAAIAPCTDHKPEGVQASPRSARGDGQSRGGV